MKIIVLAIVTSMGISTAASAQKTSFDLKSSMARGKEIYMAQCISCHMEAGEGIEGVYPPVAKSDYLMADKKRTIIQVINGLNGPIKVNGKQYEAEMTGFDMSDQELSDVLNFIRNSWGNKGDAIKPEEVKAARK